MNLRLLPAVTALVLLGLVACSETSGAPAYLTVAFRALPEPDEALGRFRTETGFDVDLSEAHVVVEAAYVLAAPKLARVHERSPFERLAARLAPSVARAHGGLPFGDDAILAQSLGPHVVDLLRAEPTEARPVRGIRGEAATLVVMFGATFAETDEPLLGRFHARLVGVASQDERAFPFEVRLLLPDTGSTRTVENIAASGTIEDGAHLEIGIRVARLLTYVHFDALPPADDRGIHVLEIDDAPGRTASLGLRTQAAYTTTIETLR